MAESNQHTNALFKAIKHFKSQEGLARRLNVSQQAISCWLNGAKEIPYQHVLMIEILTKGKISRHELSPSKKRLNDLLENHFLNSRKETI
jgi:DNA-binding transcriptional regulator YdaS (Cro superfamily)